MKKMLKEDDLAKINEMKVLYFHFYTVWKNFFWPEFLKIHSERAKNDDDDG